MIRKFWNRNEKGAVIVFLAITLPLLIVLVGGAIDFGNAYIHKSRLQNTADAAALAGARVYAINGEKATVGRHPLADEEARRYVEKDASGEGATLRNVVTNINSSESGKKPFQAGKALSNPDLTYYKVYLEETVPCYFLRILGDRFNSIDISAEAVATISATSGSGEEVFIFSRDFSLVNTISNPDNFDMDGQILTCFDAAVAYTDRNDPYNDKYSFLSLGYSDQTGNLKSFFTSNARGMSVNAARARDGVTQEALDKIWDEQLKGSKTEGIRYSRDKYVHTATYISYDMNDILRQTTGKLNIGLSLPTKPSYPTIETPYPPNEWQYRDWRYWQVMNDEEKKEVDAAYQAAYDEYTVKKAEYDAVIDAYNADVAAYEKEMEKYSTEKDTYNSSDLKKGNLAIAPGANYARTINIDGSLGSENDSPLYLYIDENCSPVHINVTASNNRPIVLCYAGRSQLDFNMSAGVTFRGILYVPNSTNAMDVLIHDSEGSKFEGSIISQSLALHGSKSTYEYKDFGVTGSGYVGGTGAGGVSPSSSVKLGVPPSDIAWS